MVAVSRFTAYLITTATLTGEYMPSVLEIPLRTQINETRPATLGKGADVMYALAAMFVREFLIFLPHVPTERAAAALQDRSPRTAVAALFAAVALETALMGTDDPMAEAVAAGARLK